MAADWIERLLADPDAPIDTIMRTVHGEGIRAVINALFAEGLRAEHSDPERALACVRLSVRLIDRIQAHAKPRRP
jgi:hypothetical protein